MLPKIIENVRRTPNIQVNIVRKRKISQTDSEIAAEPKEESVPVPVAADDANNEIGKNLFIF